MIGLNKDELSCSLSEEDEMDQRGKQIYNKLAKPKSYWLVFRVLSRYLVLGDPKSELVPLGTIMTSETSYIALRAARER